MRTKPCAQDSGPEGWTKEKPLPFLFHLLKYCTEIPVGGEGLDLIVDELFPLLKTEVFYTLVIPLFKNVCLRSVLSWSK